MFKKAKRKLVTATHEAARRARAYVAVRHISASSSDGEPLPAPRKRVFPKKRETSPRPGITLKRKAVVKNLAKPGNASQLDLDSDDRTASCAANRPPPGSKDPEDNNPQPYASIKSSARQQEAEDSSIGNEDMKFITLRFPTQQLQALLLPPFTHQRTRALVHARQDLRVVKSELPTTAAEMDNLVVAQSELEEQDYPEVPGAFLDKDAYAERERRRLLMTTIKKKIRFCELTLEDLEAQKPRLEADLEALQEQFFDDLEQAVRDDSVACASRSKAGGSWKTGVWATG